MQCNVHVYALLTIIVYYLNNTVCKIKLITLVQRNKFKEKSKSRKRAYSLQVQK